MKNTEKGVNAGFRERLCRGLDLSPDIFPHGTLVEMRGRGSVTLRGCGRVLCYNDCEMRFESREGNISVLGKRLCCSSYCLGTAVVEGYIDCVYFGESERC